LKSKYHTKKLFAFDVDGTLLTEEMKDEGQYVKGIIPTEKLIELEKNNKVVIVSPSPFLPKIYADKEHWFKKYGSNEYRWANVALAASVYGISYEDTIYVDDLEANRKQLEKLHIKSYSPEDFMTWLDNQFNL